MEIKKIRKDLGLTQAGMAAALGCCRESIIAWERGDKTPPHYIVLAARHLALDSELAKMADALQSALIAINTNQPKK